MVACVRLRPLPPARPPPPLTRVWGRRVSAQGGSTALHYAASWGRTPCVGSLLKAGADSSLSDEVSDAAEGRGGRRGWVGGGGSGRGSSLDGGPAQAPCRLSAPSSPRPRGPPPGVPASTSAFPPSLSVVWHDGVGYRQGEEPHGGHRRPQPGAPHYLCAGGVQWSTYLPKKSTGTWGGRRSSTWP